MNVIDLRHPGGRPTKYDPKYCEELLAFFDVDPWTLEEKVMTRRDGSEVSEAVRLPTRLPTFERFAHKIGVHVDTMIEWANKKDEAGNLVHPEFSEAYKRAKQLQKDLLVENGLQGLYNTPWSIFLAKNITDLRDKQEHEHTGKDGAPIVFDIMGGNHAASDTDQAGS